MNFENLGHFRIFIGKYCNPQEELKFLEIGSKDEMSRPNMVFRRYCKNKLWTYIGMDIVPGKNVDIVSQDKYSYPFADDSFDIVVCGNVLEHVEDIYRVSKEIARLTKKYIFIAVPNSCPEHKYPLDCWRIYPDGLRFLFEDIAKLKILECYRTRKNSYLVAEKI